MTDNEISIVIESTDNQVAIKSNLDKVKEQLDKKLEGFETKDFSDKKIAKETRAVINKLYDALENERKRLHNNIERPYIDFLPIYDDAIARLKECKQFISQKCKEFEIAVQLPKKTLAYIVDLDVKQQQKLEEFFQKQGIVFKVKIKE